MAGATSAMAAAAFVLVITTTQNAQSQVDNWAVSSARMLVAQGDTELAAGHYDAAARRFLDALAIDASQKAAYLGLGRAREAVGDVHEATRIYAAGITHIPAFWEAELARARLRKRVGDRDGAEADMRSAMAGNPTDRSLPEELASWRIERGAWPEALAMYRALAATARPDEQQRLRAKIKALRWLAAETDVLQSRAQPRSDRAAIEATARRRAE